MRYELRTYGWKNGRPYNKVVTKSEYLPAIIGCLEQENTYIVDTAAGIIVENIVDKYITIAV
jgi:hypothetical protein